MSLRKGQEYIGLEPGTIHDSMYEAQFAKHFTIENGKEKAVLVNNPQFNHKNHVRKSYVFDLDDEGVLRIEDFENKTNYLLEIIYTCMERA